MKTIRLTRGRCAFVDDEDFDRVNERNWFIANSGYAVANNGWVDGKHTAILMHRFVLGVSGKDRVDHISGDKLDNRSSNLRIATAQQNGFNRGKNRNNKSGRKGVCWHGAARKWRAYLTINRKQIHLGLYDDKELAGEAYRAAAVHYHGEFFHL